MAKLKNTQYATFDREAWGTSDTVTVGHNRTLQIYTLQAASPGSVELCFRLHGHPIAVKTLLPDGTVTLTLDHCGWPGVTTRSAMQDAIHLFGYWGNVSFRGGDFHCGVELSYAGKALEWHKTEGRHVTINMGKARPCDFTSGNR